MRLVILGSICAIVTRTVRTDHNLLAEWNSSAEWTRTTWSDFVKIEAVSTEESSVALMTEKLILRLGWTVLSQTGLASGGTSMFDSVIVALVALMTIIRIFEERR